MRAHPECSRGCAKSFELNHHLNSEQRADFLVPQEKIEIMMRQFKAHRCAMDFDQKFLMDSSGD
jgi:hypothetical protein